jgi:hypothetical protein
MAKVLAGAVLTAALAVASAGCGAHPATVALPKKPTRAQLARVNPTQPSMRQLVIAAYEGYWRATNEALNSRNPASAKLILADYIPSRSVSALVKGLTTIWRRHEIAYGSPVFHIMEVKITGSQTAAVHDCIDLSHMGFENSQTGQIVGGLGQQHDYLITTLVYAHGRWLVTGAIPVVRPCAY